MALVKYNNNSISSITATAALPAGAMTLIKSQTASSSSTVSFVHGTSDVVLDSTYPIYLFKFISVHPATQNVDLVFNGSTDTGSNYNVTKTSTYFYTSHSEADDIANVSYEADRDLAQSTAFQEVASLIGNDNDQAGSGELYLFNPSSTTYVKHFIAVGASPRASSVRSFNTYVGGYLNTTSAIDAIQFKMSSGNMDACTIKLYGIKDS